MSRVFARGGRVNPLIPVAVVSLLALVGIFYWLGRSGGSSSQNELMLFCAAGMRVPIVKIVAEYEKKYGVKVRVQFNGSNTLLNQINISKTGDLFLAGDDSFTDRGREMGLIEETMSVAAMRPVIVVAKGNPKNIRSVEDLFREDVRVAIGNPEQAAIGIKTKKLLTASGHWERLDEAIRARGVLKPTVPEVATDVEVRGADAGIIWDAVARQFKKIEEVRVPELDRGEAQITLGVLKSSRAPTAALRLARFITARDQGLQTFAEDGFDVVEGDVWAQTPKLRFFVGTVNRRAIEPIVAEFAAREGVEVDTVYNGCGILTASMRTMRDKQDTGFPDAYMACDLYYLKTVQDLFQKGVHVSNTEIVIVVQKGNPKQIKSLADLDGPGVRVGLGQPEQCTIGVLSRQLLMSVNLYERLVEDNLVTEVPTSAMLVPSITTGHADAVLAYVTDTLAERDKLDVIRIDSPLARAVQPYSLATSSPNKHLGGRLFDAIARGRSRFEKAGFVWQLGDQKLSLPRPGSQSTPDTKTPDTKTPDTKTPDTKTPDTKTPDTKTSANSFPLPSVPRSAFRVPRSKEPA